MEVSFIGDKFVYDELEHLIIFFNTHKRIYIYGAGQFAEYVYYVCAKRGLEVAGFITTKRDSTTCCGLSVYNLEDGFDAKIDGILPGFKHFEKQVIDSSLLDCDIFNVSSFFFRAVYIRDVFEEYFTTCGEKEEIRWENILVIRLDAIGDLVCTTPIFRQIKENYPNAKITALIQKSNEAVISGNPFIDTIIGLDNCEASNTQSLKNQIEDYSNTAKTIVKKNFSNKKFDVVILPTHLLEGRNAFLSIAIANFVEKKQVLGWIRKNGEMSRYYPYILKDYITHITIIDEPKHEIDNVLEILRPHGLKIADNKAEIYCRREKVNFCLINKDKNLKYVAVGVVGRTTKQNWKIEKYNELFESCKDRDFVFVLIGGKDAADAAKAIEKRDNVLNYINRLTLKESICLIEECDCYLGSNTGLMHIATALNKPCITLYASKRWEEDGPSRWGARNVVHIDLFPQDILPNYENGKVYTQERIKNIDVKAVKEALLDIQKFF